MNPDLDRLHPYPFERLAALKSGVTPPAGLAHVALSIGEPKHAPPAFVGEGIKAHLDGLAAYPLTRGTDALREAIAGWLSRRFQLPENSVDAQRHVIPVNGTREALFAFAQAVVDRADNPAVLMPNPFYQIYEGAALLAGASPVYINCERSTNYLPDFSAVSDDTWKRTRLLYICSPGNPAGAVMDADTLAWLMEQADRHDFVIASDECYSEIYPDEDAPPVGLLQVAAQTGRTDWRRCVVFHSLSKRSNVPGLRSGFVAGDAGILERFLRYRTYHGCAMPLPVQAASINAWEDEDHVRENRRLYNEKFSACLDILSPCLEVSRPDGGFYLWPETPCPDEEFARGLFANHNVTVLPGSYLSRESGGINPGSRHVRMALVAPLDACRDAARRIADHVASL